MVLVLNNAGKDPQQTLQNMEFISQMLAQLKVTASSEDAQVLSYLIEMAYFEVNDILNRIKLSNIKIGKGHEPTGMAM